MALFLTEDIEQLVLAGLMLTLRGAQCQGGNDLYVAGALAHAEHTCIAAHGNWGRVLDQARGSLGANRVLIDAALQLEAGNGR